MDLARSAQSKDTAAERRALLVAYSFPPVGGAGVQRVLKLTKYLPEHGIRPTVLTVANPSVPTLDPSLARDFPPGLEVIRARTFEPGYGLKQAAWSHAAGGHARPAFARRALGSAASAAKQLLIPDPQILWQPGAQAALFSRLFLRGPRPDVVFISAPPFSQFLLAPLARLRPGTAVVLDYRDEWTTYRTSYEMMGSRLGAWVGDPLEAALLRAAHVVTTATAEFREALLARFRFLDPGRVLAIPNGYDRDDFPTALPEPPTDKFTIGYAGTIFKLTSAHGFLRAIRLLHEREPALARLLSVRFMGRIVETEQSAFEGMEALGVERLGYLDHETVLRELSASHLTLCILDDVPGVTRIYPAKIFELMVLGRPCLTLAPPGALTRLVSHHRLGDVLPPRDEARICAYLEAKLRAFVSARAHDAHAGKNGNGNGHNGFTAWRAGFGAGLEPQGPIGIERYSRRALAGEFASAMREAIAIAR